MADQVQDIGIRIRADGTVETSNGVKLTADALDKLAPKAAAATKAMDAAAISAHQTTWAYRQLPMQITDVITSLASGQKPWMVAIQQGGQIKDSFGGIVPAARALLGLINPLNLAIGAGAVAAGALASAYYHGWQQSRELYNALALTGNQAGITEGQFNRLVVTLAQARNTGTGNVRELMQTIVAGGQTSGMALEATARAALALSKLNGQSAAENAKAFAGMADDVAAWATKAQKSYSYLTAEEFKAIQALQAQGRISEAVRLNMEALAGTMESRVAPSMGLIEGIIKAHIDGWNRLWDAAAGIGRAETLDERIAKLKTQLEGLDPFLRKGGYTGKDWGGDIEREIEMLQRERARGDLRTLDKGAARQAENERILKASRSYQDTLAAIESASGAKQLALAQAGLDARQVATDRAYDRLEISGAAYRDRMIAIERGRIDAEEAAARQSIAIESARVVTTEAEVNSRTAAVMQAQVKLAQLQGERAKLEGRIAAGDFYGRARNVIESPQGAFRQGELANDGNGQANKAMQERLATSMQAAHELLATNKSLNIDLIKDDQARAQAQLALEAEQMRERLDMTAGSASDRQAKEEAYANWLTLRTKKLTEDQKPEWQKMLEGWSDTTRLMREGGDAMFTSFLRSGEDAFAQLVTTGKLNVGSLVNSMIAELARVQFRKWAASTFDAGGVAGWLRSVFGGGGGASDAATMAGLWHSGGMGSDTPMGSRMLPAAVFAGAPRFHTGIGPGELPAVIRRDEGVFTAGQMRAMAPVDAVARAAGPRITYAPVINVDSRTDRAEVVALVGQAVRAGQADLLERMDRGLTH